MPFFHRSYNDHTASSCLKVATALLLLSLRIVVRLMSRYQELYLRCVQGGPNKKLCYRRRTAQRAVSVKILSIRYDTRCYFNVCSKANMSQLNLPHTEPQTKKCKTEKLKSKNRICWEVTVNSLGNPCSESWRKGKAAVVRICRKGRF